MYSTVLLKEKARHPFYKKLSYLTGSEPTWNFNKYLISKDGKSVKLFNSKVLPESNELTEAIPNFYKLIRKYFIRLLIENIPLSITPGIALILISNSFGLLISNSLTSII